MSGQSRKKRQSIVEPLIRFDYAIVSKKIEGLQRNVSMDLLRFTDKQGENPEAVRCLMLLQIMLRFAWNSYHAVAYLSADIPEDHDRKPTFALVIPNITRQLLDLLFNLVYILDDLRPRSLQYQRAGWRELYEEEQQFRTAFSSDKKWKQHFRNLKSIRQSMVTQFGITPEEEKDSKLVPYWPTPQHLKDVPTPSRPFLRHLHKWLYGDTSAQAHLSFGGLFRIAGFLLPEGATDQHDKYLSARALQQYRTQYVMRTAIVYLAIATEVDAFCTLGNHSAADFIWTAFAERAAEAKELWDLRYSARTRLAG